MTFAPRAFLIWAPTGFALGLACGSGSGETASTPSPESGPSDIVTSEDLEKTPGRPIEQVLMDRFPGITVVRPAGGGIAIRIRGTTSIHADNEPLYIIDGVPIEPGPGGALFGINPYDIETIEVLKDAASTTMYGVRGANGVIVIRTKAPPV